MNKPTAPPSARRGPTAPAGMRSPAGMNRPATSASARRTPATPAGMNRPATSAPARRTPASPAGMNRTTAADPARRMPAAPAGMNRTTAADPAYPVPTAPIGQLTTSRGLIKWILLSLITFGIYNFAVSYSISRDINIIAFRYDGRKTMNYCLLLFIIAPLTLGIGLIAWQHRISSRIGRELRRRRIPYTFGATDFWLWNVLGILIIIGPFIYLHKLLKAMNKVCEHYNVYG